MNKPPESFEPAAINAFAFDDENQRNVVFQEVVDQQAVKADHDQQFSAIHANRDFGDEGSIVRLVSVFGNTGVTDQQYVAAQYAAAFPQREYIALDLPGHGKSDSLTTTQRKAIKKDGDLGLVAGAQLEAALKLNPNLNDIVLAGEGVGQLMAVEFAAQALQRGIAVRHIFGFDPMLEERSPLGLAASYLANAQKSRNERKQETDRAGEQKLEDAFSKEFTQAIQAFGPTSEVTRPQHVAVMARERTILKFMFRKSSFTLGRGLETLEQVLDTDPKLRANMLFAGRSVVGRLTDPIQDKLDAIKLDTDGRLQYDVWPNDNQDIGLARHQPRLVAYVKDNL